MPAVSAHMHDFMGSAITKLCGESLRCESERQRELLQCGRYTIAVE
jgi:hypothetical protein